MAYLRSVLMLNAMSLDMERVWLRLLVSSAKAISVNSARLIVWRSGCDLISICVVFCVVGFTIDATKVGVSVTWDPSVYMKSFGSHAAQYGRIRVESDVYGFMGVEANLSV